MLLLTLYMLFCIFEKYLFYFLPHWRLGVTLKILQSFRLFCNWIFVVFHLKVGSVHFILTRARSFISARVVCDIFGNFYCLVFMKTRDWSSILFPLSSFYLTFGKEVGKKGLNQGSGEGEGITAEKQYMNENYEFITEEKWERFCRWTFSSVIVIWSKHTVFIH